MAQTRAAAYDFTKLRVGDAFALTGTVFTARDRAHGWLLAHDFAPLHGGIVFHCGPIVAQQRVVAAGPTTSSRVDAVTPELIARYRLAAIIGKGGMGRDVLEAMRGRCVYFAAVGGAGLSLAKHFAVKNVTCPEFGMAEAIWELEAKELPLIVAMDSRGRSLYDEVERSSHAALERLLRKGRPPKSF